MPKDSKHSFAPVEAWLGLGLAFVLGWGWLATGPSSQELFSQLRQGEGSSQFDLGK